MPQIGSKPATRTESYGEAFRPTVVDRFGVWLSAKQLRGHFDFRGKRVADLGCGYHAVFSRSILREVAHMTLVDVSLAPDLKGIGGVTAIEGALPESLLSFASESQDAVLCISVLEHLWEPLRMLMECRRLLSPGGVLFVNVPSWRGKLFLEFSAFRLGLSPAPEMDDHKMYYDVRDLWPLLVQAGFRPQFIRCFPHKFGLNTFAVCRTDG